MSSLYRTFMLAPQPAQPQRFLDAVHAALAEAGAELVGPGRGPGLWHYRCPFQAAEDVLLSLTYLRGLDIPAFIRPVAMEIDCPYRPVLTGGDPEQHRGNFRWLIKALEHLFVAMGAAISCSGDEDAANEDVLYHLVDPLLAGEPVSGPQFIHVGPVLAPRLDRGALERSGATIGALANGGLRLEFAPAEPGLYLERLPN